MTPQLFTLAFPDMQAADCARIAAFRQIHDQPLCGEVDAHFTLGFGLTTVPEDIYTTHVSLLSAATAPIAFTCRYAMPVPDHEAGTGCIFLVPDDGFAAVSRLHDRLYTGPLAAALRLDLPYIPHMTIGRVATLPEAKALCDDWNAAPFAISGTLTALTVMRLDDGHVSRRATVPLTGHSAS